MAVGRWKGHERFLSSYCVPGTLSARSHMMFIVKWNSHAFSFSDHEQKMGGSTDVVKVIQLMSGLLGVGPGSVVFPLKFLLSSAMEVCV